MQWKVTAYTGKNRDKVLGHSWVNALTESQAMAIGKTVLRMTGVRGRYLVSARLYTPLTDPAFCGYVQRLA